MIETKCQISIFLAYAMASYIIASIYYLVMTMWAGTPFKDSLTEEQKKIKKQSADKRRSIFFQGIFISIILLKIFNPFKKCTNGK